MSRLVTGIVVLIVVILVAIRFVNREADFPRDLRSFSGDIYTDEGWYNHAAVEHVRAGTWYVPGDMNTSISLPVSPLIQRVVFAVHGMNLSSARLTVCVAFMLTVVFVSMLAWRFGDSLGAALAALFISINLLLFGYSRIATLDLLSTMFAVAALTVVVRPNQPPGSRRLAVGGLLLAVAVLTKFSAAFAVPLAAAGVWMPGRPLRENLRQSITIALIPLFVVGAYMVFAYRSFPDDYTTYFGTIAPDATHPLQTAYLAVKRVDYVGRGFAAGTAVLALMGFALSRAWRTNRLTWLCFGWIAIVLILLTTRTYVPPRYYIPLVVPLALLAGTAVARITFAGRTPVIAGLAWLVAAGVVAIEGRKLIAYMRAPEYSFVEMARQVATIVNQSEHVNGQRSALLLGAVADSVGLETGVRTLASVHSPRPVGWKIERYDPTHWIAFADGEIRPDLEVRYRLIEVGSWDVFDNYRAGERVRLFALERRSATR